MAVTTSIPLQDEKQCRQRSLLQLKRLSILDHFTEHDVTTIKPTRDDSTNKLNGI